MIPWLAFVASAVAFYPQDEVEALRIERAAARYVREHYHDHILGLEDRAQEFATPHAPTGPTRAGYRSREHLKRLAEDAGATIIEQGSFVYCSSQQKPGCIEMAVRIGVPEQRGDTATVWLYVREPAADSEVDSQLLLVRRGGNWSVERPLQFREALFEPPPSVRQIAGCYRFDRAYFISIRFDSATHRASFDSTAMLRLFEFATLSVAGPRAMLVVPIPPPRDSAERRGWLQMSSWRELSPDSIQIAWRNGRFGPVFRMRHADSVLSGSVIQTTDLVGADLQRAPATAARITCP